MHRDVGSRRGQLIFSWHVTSVLRLDAINHTFTTGLVRNYFVSLMVMGGGGFTLVVPDILFFRLFNLLLVDESRSLGGFRSGVACPTSLVAFC